MTKKDRKEYHRKYFQEHKLERYAKMKEPCPRCGSLKTKGCKRCWNCYIKKGSKVGQLFNSNKYYYSHKEIKNER